MGIVYRYLNKNVKKMLTEIEVVILCNRSSNMVISLKIEVVILCNRFSNMVISLKIEVVILLILLPLFSDLLPC
jgi:hypothetical protein